LNTVSLAKLADKLGYNRYWIAEHHGSSIYANPNPDVMVSLLANETRRIRIGSGGVLLPYYPAYKVAETYGVLSTMFPNRIDLGMGKSYGTDNTDIIASLTGETMSARLGISHFQNKVKEIKNLYSTVEQVSNTQINSPKTIIQKMSTPELWWLGSSVISAETAGTLGVSYSYAHFINEKDGIEAIKRYKYSLNPVSKKEIKGNRQQANLAVYALACDSEDEAQIQRKCMIAYILGNSKPKIEYKFPQLSEAESMLFDEHDPSRLQSTKNKFLIGTVKQMTELLNEMAFEHGVQELVIIMCANDIKLKRRSLQLLSKAFELTNL
jgi:luciferase family oxidoreductase group 1